MSASNWDHCPRCSKAGEAALAARQAEIDAAYGKVSVEEFDQMRAGLAQQRKSFEDREDTFREDYEIYGAHTGVVNVGYHGQCTKCGLRLAFDEDHPIPGLDA